MRHLLQIQVKTLDLPPLEMRALTCDQELVAPNQAKRQPN